MKGAGRAGLVNERAASGGSSVCPVGRLPHSGGCRAGLHGITSAGLQPFSADSKLPTWGTVLRPSPGLSGFLSKALLVWLRVPVTLSAQLPAAPTAC